MNIVGRNFVLVTQWVKGLSNGNGWRSILTFFFSLLHPSPKLKTIGLILLHLGFSLLLVTVSYYRSSKVILACIVFLATWLHLTLFSLSVRFRSISNSEIHQRFLALLQFCVFLYWVLIGSLYIPSFWIYIYIYMCMYIICFCVFSTLN